MDTKERFQQKGQGHVFQYWESLDQEEKKILQEQADEIDLDELGVLVSQLVFSKEGSSLIDFSKFDPAPYEPLPADIHGDEKWQEAKVAGEAALRSGRVAAFTVAGGQGTRLGYDGPKGTYPISPIKNKTLFQLFAEKIKAARCRYDCEIPWYLMTSHVNHEATISFFQENNHFGLGEGSVRFFRQGRMPAVDFEGKILMESKGSIAMSPDGHGGALRALERNGILDEMEAKGIDLMSYFQVDNPHVQVIDPYFLGFHVLSGSSMSSKMLPKAYEKEKLGHFCVLGNRLEIVEYSDMPDELTAQRDEKGQLRFIAGSVAIHIVSVDFIRKLTSKNSSIALPFHKALKKIACSDSNGEKIVPSEPNGVKFELFVFDALPFAGKPMIIETTRLGDFSPVKNAEGVDSAVTCRADQQRLFAQWLDEVGVSVEKDSEGVPLRKIEVSPLFGYNLETFRESWKNRGLKVDFSQDAYIE